MTHSKLSVAKQSVSRLYAPGAGVADHRLLLLLPHLLTGTAAGCADLPRFCVLPRQGASKRSSGSSQPDSLPLGLFVHACGSMALTALTAPAALHCSMSCAALLSSKPKLSRLPPASKLPATAPPLLLMVVRLLMLPPADEKVDRPLWSLSAMTQSLARLAVKPSSSLRGTCRKHVLTKQLFTSIFTTVRQSAERS